jgi:phosphoenolpyruvate synthase/pyruvate phosphate dikinase
MPGMMDTILNLGLNDETVQALAKNSGDESFAFNSYRRLIQMFGDVVLEIEHSLFDKIIEAQREKRGVKIVDKAVVTQVIVDKVRETGAKVVAMSALITPTFESMRGVVELLEERSEVLHGHAVVPSRSGERPELA